MSTGYRSTIDDIRYLLSVASLPHRNHFAALVQAQIEQEGEEFLFFDVSGAPLALGEIHRRSQAVAEVQRSVYNMSMTYAH